MTEPPLFANASDNISGKRNAAKSATPEHADDSLFAISSPK
jgi:hypothetical protein